MSVKVKRRIIKTLIFVLIYIVGMGFLGYIFRSLAYGKIIPFHHTFITNWLSVSWSDIKKIFKKTEAIYRYPEGYRPIFDTIFDYIVLFSPLIILAIYAFYKRKPIMAYIQKKYNLWKSRTKNERIKRLEEQIKELNQKSD